MTQKKCAALQLLPKLKSPKAKKALLQAAGGEAFLYSICEKCRKSIKEEETGKRKFTPTQRRLLKTLASAHTSPKVKEKVICQKGGIIGSIIWHGGIKPFVRHKIATTLTEKANQAIGALEKKIGE